MFCGDFTLHTKYTERKNNILRQKNFEGEIGVKECRLKDASMVFSGKRSGGGVRETEEEDMDRLNRLHNFNLPYLKWGNQKLLRCMKVDSNGEVLNQSLETCGIGTRPRESEFQRGFRSSDDDRTTESNYKVLSSEKVKATIGVAGNGEIYEIREKLMPDFQKEISEMKDAVFRERLADPPPPATTTTTFNSPVKRPWNLRTRRAACKAPRSPPNGVNCNGEIMKPNSSPARNESEYPKLRHTSGVANATAGCEKIERPKFSISLSRREVEEDFTTMSGRRLPRKPKKRPRIVQKQLDTLFPGLWLSEITADLYKVPEEADTGKR